MKSCSRCKEAKPESEFNKNRSLPHGLQSECRSCQLATNREWAERHPDVRAAAQRRDYAKHGRRPSKAVAPHKRRAEQVAQRAVKTGKLVRPDNCQNCGKNTSIIHAHHPDYARPLEVEWLCVRCHGRQHVEMRKRATA